MITQFQAKQIVDVPRGAKCTVKTTNPFIIKGLVDGNFADIIGPLTTSQRAYTFNSQNFSQIEVETKGHWTLQVIPIGRMEEPDPVPIEIPDSYKRPLTLREELMTYVRDQISMQAISQEHESFEEADDFDVDDDEDVPLSGYEVQDMQPEYIDESLSDDKETKDNTDLTKSEQSETIKADGEQSQ